MMVGAVLVLMLVLSTLSDHNIISVLVTVVRVMATVRCTQQEEHREQHDHDNEADNKPEAERVAVWFEPVVATVPVVQGLDGTHGRGENDSSRGAGHTALFFPDTDLGRTCRTIALRIEVFYCPRKDCACTDRSTAQLITELRDAHTRTDTKKRWQKPS